jgi:hypothetical protein
MRRLTRGIGLFGGPGATMTAKRVKFPPVKTAEQTSDDHAAAPDKPAEPPPAKPAQAERKSWLGRLFGSDEPDK